MATEPIEFQEEIYTSAPQLLDAPAGSNLGVVARTGGMSDSAWTFSGFPTSSIKRTG